MDSTSSTQTRSRRSSEMPFEELSNLPNPVIPKINLGIQRMELVSMLQVKPSLTSFRKVGYSVEDHSTQTEHSDILDLKYTIQMLQTLTQDIGQLRKDLSFSQHVLKANYERQISDRSTELYCRINEKFHQLERQHKMKVETIRKSYQTQLDDAIQKIAGEYKSYYDELLQGKTGRHDLIIRDLKDQLSEREVLVRQQETKIEDLLTRLGEKDEVEIDREPSPPPPPPGISLEEAEQLQQQINQLENEVDRLKLDLAEQEDEYKQLMKQFDSLNKQLNDQKGKFMQLEKDMDNFKKKAKQEKEKAARMAETQLVAMQKKMKEKMETAEKEAAQKAQEQAEMQRMRDQAKFQEAMDKQKDMEEKLRAEADMKPETIGDQELLSKLQLLKDIEEKQKTEITRLESELERTNRVWELKMTVMRKNFHSLKDEFFIRHNLQRQSATLHHATVGYAVTGDMPYKSPRIHPKDVKPLLPRLKFNSHQMSSLSERPRSQSLKSSRDTSSPHLHDSILTIPPPSPNTTGLSPRNVHFDEDLSVDLRSSSRTEDVKA